MTEGAQTVLPCSVSRSVGMWQELWSISYNSLMVGDTNEMSGLDEVDEIVNLAKIKNQKLGITGTLVYDASKRKVFQVLEGPRYAVLDLYETIVKDTRHRETTTTASESIQNRQFDTWMAVQYQSGIAKLPTIGQKQFHRNQSQNSKQAVLPTKPSACCTLS